MSSFAFRFTGRPLSTLLAALLLSGAALAADPEKQKADYERQLESVNVLSKALTADPKAGTPEVKGTLDQVGARRKEAEELAAVGEYDLAKSILQEGYNTLTRTLAKVKSNTGYAGPSGSMSGMSGMAGADGKPLALTKMKADFERELMSAKSMLDAAKRADTETGGRQSREISDIESLISKAVSAASKEDYPAADKLIDEAIARERKLITATKGSSDNASKSTAAADTKADQEKKLAAFDSRMNTARAMLPAVKSQNTQKNAGKDGKIAEIEQKLTRAESLRNSDITQAQKLADEAYADTRATIHSMQTKPTVKSGSEALEPNTRDMRAMSGMSGEEKKATIQAQLRSAQAVRNAYERKAKEKGVDAAPTLSRIDQLTSDAKRLEGSQPEQALRAADEAYHLAKSSLEQVRQ